MVSKRFTMQMPRRCTFARRYRGSFAALFLLTAACRSAPPAPPSTSTPDGSGFTVPAGDVRLWVRSVGEGPPLVVINGGPGASHHAVARLESLASPKLRVVLYDQRGMGGSSAPANDRDFDLDHYVADLDAVRNGLGVEKIHVLGHSFGGLVAMGYAAAHPERVASLILVSSNAPSWADHKAGAAGFQKRYEKLLAEKKIPADPPKTVGDDCRAESNAFVPLLLADPDFIKEPLEEMKTTACSVRVRDATAKSMRGYDYRPRLRSFAAPTLVVIGDSDPFGDAHAVMNALENAHPEYAVMPKCGHFPWVESPDAFRPVVERFLARVTQLK
ncbi:MAG: alpha/beta hydrolase [Polyangiaceae bacterium]